MNIGGSLRVKKYDLKKKKKLARKRKIEWIIALQVVLIIVFLLILTKYFHGSSPQPGYSVNPSRAVIIDGVALTKPNPQFIQSVKEILSQAGLKVNVYQGKEVTINLLRKIRGYGLIILRVHSAIDKFGFLYIFSAEKYNETGYSNQRICGAVREGITFENESYFALRADLLGYMNKESLNGSTIILMGCNGTNSQYAINKFFKRGVKAIIAWNGYVDLEYSDNITINLLKAVYEDKMNFQKAVERIMNEYGLDPEWKSKLECLIQTNR